MALFHPLLHDKYSLLPQISKLFIPLYAFCTKANSVMWTPFLQFQLKSEHDRSGYPYPFTSYLLLHISIDLALARADIMGR